MALVQCAAAHDLRTDSPPQQTGHGVSTSSLTLRSAMLASYSICLMDVSSTESEKSEPALLGGGQVPELAGSVRRARASRVV